jgi:DNA polymerase-3 subunit gamma/tau
MLKRLKDIAKLEQLELSDSALSLLVRQSEGGMRDALSLLDQIVSACGNTPSDEAVTEALGTIDRQLVTALAAGLVKRDAKLLLRRVDEAWNRGFELARVAEELALTLRHLFVAKVTGTAPDELADADREGLLALSREADAAQLARLFDVVHAATWEIGRAAQPKLAFEMALLKGLYLAPAGSLPDLVARVERLVSATGAPALTAGALGGGSAPANFRA